MNNLFKNHKVLIFLFLFVFANFYSKSQAELWGVTQFGGDDNLGTLFSVPTGSNNLSSSRSFTIDYPGANPYYTKLCLAGNGKLYGVTQYGGAYNSGVLFEYDPLTKVYYKRIDFSGTINGSFPTGSLIQASNGNIYGMTANGGLNNMGILFEYNLNSGVLIKKIDFSLTLGSYPKGSLVEADNGKLYGMTSNGGGNNMGVLFEFDPSSDIYNKLLDFNGTVNGRGPNGDLIQANNGRLYGMTSSGGSNNFGVMFEYDINSNVYTKKVDFTGASNGRNPHGSLVQSSNGKLYGITNQGGINGVGVLFEFDLSLSSLVKKIDFSLATGGSPFGNLVEASNGMLYAVTNQGGANSRGVLFEYNTNTNTYSKKFDFISVNGQNPYGSLVQVGNQKLYGMANGGGIYNGGILFEYDFVSDVYSKQLDFKSTANGQSPIAGLVKADNDRLYGMTSSGGSNNVGELFEFNPSTHIFTKKIDFNLVNGSNPWGNLIQANNGKLYALTSKGGVNDKGVLFEYDPVSEIFLKKFDFDGAVNGATPKGGLIQASNGKLYGMTTNGGVNNLGVLFEYDFNTNTYVKHLDFDGTTNGQNPFGSLIQLPNGKMYGVTSQGGVNNFGVLFEFDPNTNVFLKKIDFTTATGTMPYGNLTLAANGKLYGLTNSGGINDLGVLFEFDPVSESYIKLLDFNGVANGSSPYGSLMLAGNKKIYGVTYSGGANDLGVLFEFEPISGTYTKYLDFNRNNGANPQYVQLIEICSTPTITVNSSNALCNNSSTGSSTISVYGGSPFTFTWSPTGGNSNSASGLSAGTYTCDIKDACGQTYSISTSINQPDSITLSVSGESTICSGESAVIFATAFGGTGTIDYVIEPSNIGVGTYTVIPNSTTVYTITATDNNNCFVTKNVVISVNDLPFILATTNNSLLCSGESSTLSVSGASSYTWSTLENTTEIVVTPSTTTVYSVTGTDTNGCSNQAIINQNVDLCTSLKIHSLLKNTLIYPSPTTGNLWIELNYQTSITIINSLGETIFNMEMLQGKNELKLSDQPNGVYYLKLKHNNNQEIFKVVKVN